VPFLFGILGGIVAYFAVRNRNPKAANKLLILGIIFTLISFMLGAAIYLTP